MGKPTGFMEFEREAVPYRDPLERLNDYDEINTSLEEGHLQTQRAHYADCGVPFLPIRQRLHPIDNHLRVEPSRLSKALERGNRSPAQDE